MAAATGNWLGRLLHRHSDGAASPKSAATGTPPLGAVDASIPPAAPASAPASGRGTPAGPTPDGTPVLRGPDHPAAAQQQKQKHLYSSSSELMAAASAIVQRVLSSLGRSSVDITSEGLAATKSRRASDWSLDLTESDLYGVGADTELFIHSHSIEKIREYLERYGIWQHALSKDFYNLQVLVDLSNPYSHRCILQGEHAKLATPAKLLEIVMHRATDVTQLRCSAAEVAGPGQQLFVSALHEMSKERPLDLSVVEWLVLQNPAEAFKPDRRRLPDQEYPGLGCLANMNRLLVEVAQQNHRDALINAPAHFHNAYLYGVKGGYIYGNPQMEGAFRTLHADVADDIEKHGLADVTYAILYGRLRTSATGGPVKWVPEDQLYPISDRIHAYFKSAPYQKLKTQATIAAPPGETRPAVFYIAWDDDAASSSNDVLQPVSLVQAVQHYLMLKTKPAAPL